MEKKITDLKLPAYLLLIGLGFFQVFSLKAQNYFMPTGTGTATDFTCGGTFFDSGGPGANYTSNDNSTQTFCTNVPGECITVFFADFSVSDFSTVGVARDYLKVFDGPTNAPGGYLYDIAGGPFPATFPVASTTGCLTFQFVSNGNTTVDIGWRAFISCQPCPEPVIPSQQDCNGAISVCEEQYYQPNGYIGNNGSNIVPGSSCLLNGEINNAWYVFTAETNGSLGFNISPNISTNNYDWAVYNITNTGCEGINNGTSPEISCNYSTNTATWAGQTGANSASPYSGSGTVAGASGGSFNANIPAVAGNTYAIVVSNASTTQGGYYLNLAPSTQSLFNVSSPSIIQVESVGCIGNQVRVKFSEPVLCNSLQVTDFLLTGPGGPYTVSAITLNDCSGGAGEFVLDAILTFSPVIIGSGSYSLCITNISGGIEDLCKSTTTSGCFSYINAELTAFAHGTSPTCATNCNGTATVNVVGGTLPYTYSWSNGGNTQSISSLCGGTYTVTVTDANGCIASSFTPTSNCFLIQGVLVNSCGNATFPAHPNEADEEMVFFQVGTSPLSTSGLTVTWPTLANTWSGICTNSTYLAAANATITAGGILLPLPGTGILPANANVVIITSNFLNAPVANFSNLSDTLYVIFQCSGNTQGHFGNNASTLSNPLILNFGGGCSQSVNYIPSSLPNFGGSGDGGYVLYSPDGTPTYLNYGCTIPYITQTNQVNLITPAPLLVGVNPISPIICSGSNTILTASGATSYVWSPSNGLSATTGATVTANPTSSTTYTVSGTSGGCTETATTLVTVLSPSLPALSPAIPCAGSSVNFTASNGSLYEFTLNGNSQGPPSSTSTFTSPVLAAGDQVCVKSYPITPFVYDGNIIEPEWGNPLARSTGGPALSGFGAGNNLDALYINNAGGFLNGAIASNLVNNSNNRILLFIDCQVGGFNTLTTWLARSNSPYYSVENLNSNITFDAGFTADYVLAMNQASANAFFDLYNMVGNSNNFIGNATASTLLGFVGNAGVGNFTQGFEFSFPLSAIGNPTGAIKFFAMMVNDPGIAAPTLISNQFLTPAGPGENNYGSGPVNFAAAVPNPISYSLNPDCFQQTCVTASNPITPTFTQVAAICTGATLAALPTTSNNGITGTWLPALNNTTTTLYTFTPAAGFCATPTTMTITVNTPVTPTFTQVAPICSGATLTALPTTSTNGITGTWLPAINNTTTTLYTFTPSAGVCATSATMTITVNTPVTTTFTQVSAICAGAALSALPTTSSNGITGTWLPAINNTTTTLYTFTPTAGVCATSATMTITVNPAPSVTSASPSYSTCSGPTLATASTSTINLTPNPVGATINWTGSNGSSGTGSPIANPVPNNTCTDLVVNYTITPSLGTCTGTALVVPVTIRPKPVATFTVSPNPICLGQNATVTFVGTSCPGSTYNWTWPAGVNVISGTGAGPYTIGFASASTFNISLQVVGPASLGSCTSQTFPVSVTVNAPTVPTFTVLSPFCAGQTAPLLVNTSNNSITGTWSPLTVNNSTSATYTFTPTAGQCASVTTLNSTVTPSPISTPIYHD